MKNSRLSQSGSKSNVGLSGLKALRKSRPGLSLENLAREVDVTVGHLWKVENCQRNASTDLVQRLCEYFACTPNDLMGYQAAS